MTALTKFQCLGLDCGSGLHDFTSDQLMVMLTNAAPDVATDTVKSDITEIAAANGYSAGGMNIDLTTFTQTAGVAKLVLADSDALTATGGSVGPFRYCVIYNSVSNALIGFGDYGSALTLTDTQTFKVSPSPTTGILTIT